eukprot:GFUD01019611.1.p1 GENE.GFUD01019611.1~~GFUD01019611.1.p1  ORF type:complete len:108 (+),score=21.10 GFUD01019611.1:107-430(+)
MVPSILLLLSILSPLVISIRPYVTCVGCETFLQCFLTCPVADYPGVNKYGVYIPKFLRDIGSSFDSTPGQQRRSYQPSMHNTYRNWRAYDPKTYKDYFKKYRRRRRK